MLQILLVDDDPVQLRIRQAVLRSAGHVVNIAADAEAALACLNSLGSAIGLIITDHNLPGRRGPELVREVLRSAPFLPVIILSGMPDIESEYEGLNVIFRVKPLPTPELIQLVGSFLSTDSQHPAANAS